MPENNSARGLTMPAGVHLATWSHAFPFEILRRLPLPTILAWPGLDRAAQYHRREAMWGRGEWSSLLPDGCLRKPEFGIPIPGLDCSRPSPAGRSL
jgi:hypothetical protein